MANNFIGNLVATGGTKLFKKDQELAPFMPVSHRANAKRRLMQSYLLAKQLQQKLTHHGR